MRDFTQIEFADDSVLVYQPRFTDESRTRIKAFMVLPNGQLMETEKDVRDQDSRFIRDIFLQYTEEEILQFTARENIVLEKKQKAAERAAEVQAREEEKAVTFQAKVKALEIPEVRDFPDVRITRRLRKAKSPFEVAAIVALILQKTYADEPTL